MTRKPRPRACSAKATISRGVRWADNTRTSTVTPSCRKIAAAGSIVGRSESLPITTATRAEQEGAVTSDSGETAIVSPTGLQRQP